jgi:hypothetical protein
MINRDLLYGDVVHVSSSSLIHVHWHERVTTVGNFYTEDAKERLEWPFDLINFKTTYDNHGVLG